MKRGQNDPSDQPNSAPNPVPAAAWWWLLHDLFGWLRGFWRRVGNARRPEARDSELRALYDAAWRHGVEHGYMMCLVNQRGAVDGKPAVTKVLDARQGDASTQVAGHPGSTPMGVESLDSTRDRSEADDQEEPHIFLVQVYADDGWAVGVNGAYVGLEEWQFKRLKAMGIPELTREEASVAYPTAAS